MNHGNKINHLGRKTAHRKAMLSNMACSLILHKRINTTLAKAKALRKYVEPLITKSKTDSTHSRRITFSYLKQKEAVQELFGTLAGKVADRPGGYTRIIKLGTRLGDNAEMAMIELVDFNEVYAPKEARDGKTRRSRRRKKGGSTTSDSLSKDTKATSNADNEAPSAATVSAQAADQSREDTTDTEASAPEVMPNDEGVVQHAPKNDEAEQAPEQDVPTSQAEGDDPENPVDKVKE